MNYQTNVTCERSQEDIYLPVMAYVPKQELKAVYEPEQALRCGTLFPELYKPFKGGCRRG